MRVARDKTSSDRGSLWKCSVKWVTACQPAGESGGDSGGTQARVKTFAGTSLHNVNALSTSVTFPDGSATPPNRVRVAVTYTYIPWLSQFITTPTMHTYAEGRMIVP